MGNELLVRLIDELGLKLTPEQAENFELYSRELREWNKKVNLTAIEEPEQIVIKHFYDSLLVMQLKSWPKEGTLLDMGTGAGFPGLPLAIVNDKLSLTLVDSLQKRIVFLEHMVEQLKLTGVRSIHARAEELGINKEHRERYDLVVSRAVARLPVLLEYCLPLLKKGGIFFAYKGPEAEEEIQSSSRALEVLGGKIIETMSFSLPLDNGTRCLVAVGKTKQTPQAYPRRPGTPAKKPL